MRATLTLALALAACAPAAAPAPKAKSAQDWYTEGKLQYQVEQYQAALDAWENCYLLHPDPALLYDLGQANLHLGRYDRALESFRGYLAANPKARDRAAVEQLIEETRKLARHRR
jgi:tetratricopeptide (TPR) repeat protein